MAHKFLRSMTSAQTTDCQQRQFQLPYHSPGRIWRCTCLPRVSYNPKRRRIRHLFHVFLDCKAIEPKPFWWILFRSVNVNWIMFLYRHVVLIMSNIAACRESITGNSNAYVCLLWSEFVVESGSVVFVSGNNVDDSCLSGFCWDKLKFQTSFVSDVSKRQFWLVIASEVDTGTRIGILDNAYLCRCQLFDTVRLRFLLSTQS